ncbi:MAG TPA: hypothetical protein VGR28_08570 [Candidatus Thermoplasmatota archaeon]|jgi:hypothetical protein|nr:hypothetical protein [Candidatus Thermoplasmatota archaeon]
MPSNAVLVNFACPMCTAPQQVGLIALSRAGFHACSACGRRLKPAQVSQALHQGPPVRALRAPGFDSPVPGTRTRVLR